MLMPAEQRYFMLVEQMLGEAIDLYREYVECYGYEPELARAQAIVDTLEGASASLEALRREANDGSALVRPPGAETRQNRRDARLARPGATVPSR